MEKFKNKKIISYISIAAVVIIIAFFGSLFVFNNNLIGVENKIKAQIGQLENKTDDEIKNALNEAIEDGSLRVSINANPVFIKGTDKGNLQIENHPNNKYNLRCVITANTGKNGKEETLYQSGLMPVNSHIQKDVLNKNLEKGEYDAVATFTAYDVETDKAVGKVVTKIHLSILS